MTDEIEPGAIPAPPSRHHPRSWRDFLIEMAAIVLGILIALAVDQIADDVRWNQAVKQARAAIHEEIAFNNGFLQVRVRGQPCLTRRLDQIDAALTAAEATGRLAAVPGANVNTGGPINDAQWQTARAAQTLAHFPPGELAQLSRYYDNIRTFKEVFLSEESNAWRWLGDLEAGPHAASSSDLMQLRYHLRVARRYNALIPFASRTLLDTGAKFDVKPTARNAEAWDKLCKETGG